MSRIRHISRIGLILLAATLLVTGYTTYTLSAGAAPIAYWKFDDGNSTTAQDSSTNNNDGTLSGATWQTEDMCVAGKCLYFDGSNDYVNMGDQFDTTYNSASTYELWIRTKVTTSGVTIFNKHDYDGNYSGWGVEIMGSQSLRFQVMSNLTNRMGKIWSTNVYQDNKWHHITITKGDNTASNLKLYIDSVEQTTVTTTYDNLTSDVSTDINFEIGARDTTNSDFTGFIDDAKIFNYARTAAQIKADYNAGKAHAGVADGAAAALGANKDNSDALSNGLVGYWKMDEGSWNGTTNEVVDSSGNGKHGTATCTGAGCTKPTTAAAKFGSGGSFDGTDDYVNASNTNLGLSGGTSFSASFWIKTTDTSGRVIQKQISDGWNSIIISLGTTTAGKIYFSPQSQSLSQYPTWDQTSAAINDGNWHHVAVTFRKSGINASDGSIYIDGSAVSTNYTAYSYASNFAMQESSNNLVFGIRPINFTDPLSGSLDDVRIYNRALSNAEVRALYEWAPGPAAYWKLDEGTGTTTNDTSGNSYTGTLTGGPTWTQGKYGKAVNFDGSDDFIDVGTGPTIVNSVSFWAKPSSTTEYFIDLNGSAYVWANAGTVTASGFTTPTIYVNGVATTSISANTWSHVEVTTATAINASDVDIGRLEGTDNYQGQIDEVKLYNYARTQKQIVSDMNAGHPSVGSPVGSAVGNWKFDEGTNTIANNSGSGGSALNGTLTGATHLPTWSNSGKFGKAINFDGIDDYVSVPYTPSLDFKGSQTSFTISTWIKMNSIDGVDGGIAGRWYNDGAYQYILKFETDTNDIKFAVYDTTYQIAESTTNSIATGGWYHILGVADNGTLKVYINGKQNGTTDTYGTITDIGTEENIEIGITGRAFNTDWFPGTIDEVKIYNYALSEDEVKLEYNHGKALVMGAKSTDASGNPDNSSDRSYCPPGDTTATCAPVAEWALNEGINTTAYDTSGNNHTGTLTSTTWTSGKYGKGVNMNSSSSKLTALDADDLSSSSFTLNFWFRWNQGQCGWPRIGKMGTTSQDTQNEYSFQFEQCDGRWYFRANNSAVIYAQANGQSLDTTLNKWHQITIAYDSTTSKLRIIQNGSRVLLDVTTSFTTTPTAYNFLAYQAANYSLIYDHISFYNYARSAAQIAWDYNRGAPVAQWKFDDCTGTTAEDWSPNSNGGYNTNDATITIGNGVGSVQDAAGTCTDGVSTHAWYNGASGKYNASLNFDGVDDYAATGNVALITANAATYNKASWGGWFYPASSAVSKTLVHKNNEFRLTTDASGNPQCEVYSGSWQTAATATIAMSLNTWQHLFCTYDGTNINLYVDGRLVKTQSQSNNITSSSSTAINIGRDSAATGYFSGQVDDVRIYNYTPTNQQIKTIYNNEKALRY